MSYEEKYSTKASKQSINARKPGFSDAVIIFMNFIEKPDKFIEEYLP